MRAALSTLTAQLLLTILLVSATGVLVAVFLTWILTRPILALVAATKSVAKGDFTPRVPRWADDEIGDLAEAFNAMTEELAYTDELRRVSKLLAEKGYRLEVTEAAREYLAETGYDPHFGARPLKRAIQRELQDPLALKILAGAFKEGETIRVERSPEGLEFAAGVEVVQGEVVEG